jgi:hypothetical protein
LTATKTGWREGRGHLLPGPSIRIGQDARVPRAACLLGSGVGGLGLLGGWPVAARGAVRGHQNGAGATPQHLHDFIIGGLPEVEVKGDELAR